MTRIVSVLLHHFGGSRRSWARVLELVPGAVALDLPGFGDAARDDEPCISVAAMADAVLARIAARDLGRYALVGHSMGGKIAFAIAARAPAELERLVLVAPSPPSPEPMSDEARRRLLTAHAHADRARETNGNLTLRPLDAGALDSLVEDNLRCSERAWRWWLERGSREDLSRVASNVRAPATVIAGDADPVMATDMLQREVVARLPRARMIVVPSGHLIPIEAPRAVANAVEKSCRENVSAHGL